MREHDLARLSTAAPGACPDADDLARLASGDLPDAERLPLIDHLAWCDACAQEYKAGIGLEPWARRAVDVLRAADPLPSPRDARPGFMTGLAVAASVAMVCATGWALMLRGQVTGLRDQMASMRPATELAAIEATAQSAANRAARLEQELVAGRAPDLNSPIVDLVPGATRGTSREIVVRLPDGARYVTLVFTLDAAIPHGRTLALEIAAPDGRVVGRWPGLMPSTFATATAVVPTALLPPGSYRVRLLREGGGDPIQQYALQVRRAGDGG